MSPGASAFAGLKIDHSDCDGNADQSAERSFKLDSGLALSDR
jgi:hypothetical protein